MMSSTPTRSYLKSASRAAVSGYDIGHDADVAMLIDNVAVYPTPEGLALTLVPAGFLPRLSAWLIDSLIKLIALSIVSVFGAFFGEAGVGLIAIGFFLINWFYPVYFEVYRNGMTPGKKSRDIYVCHDDGTPITLQASLIRNLLRVADFLPLLYVSAIICMLFNKRSQRLGDIVAGTIVVYRNEDDMRKLFQSVYGLTASTAHNGNDENEPKLRSIDERHMPNMQGKTDYNKVNINSPLFYYPLTLAEQQALLSFAERAPFLSKARQVEIAATLTPLMNIDSNSSMQIGMNPDKETQIIHTLNERIRNIHGYSTLGSRAQQPLGNHSVNKGGIKGGIS